MTDEDAEQTDVKREEVITEKTLETVPLLTGTSGWWQEYYMPEWPVGEMSNLEIYNTVPLVRRCITILAQFSTRKGFETQVIPHDPEVKKVIDDVNKRVNLDFRIYQAIILRELYGRAAFEIVYDNLGNVTSLLPLNSMSIRPVIDKRTFEIAYFEYIPAKNGRLRPEQVLYFALDPLTTNMIGRSSIDPIRNTIKTKINLERDLQESAKRLWAPIGLFEMDTRAIPDPKEKKRKMQEFAQELKPGRSVVHNTSVKSKILDLKPDMIGLVKAIEKMDEEIMGNFAIPKALLSREKTLSKATLEFSIKCLYDGPVASIQRYFKREIERQFYDRILQRRGWAKDFTVKHIWRPITIYSPELINALVKAVSVGAMTKKEMFHIMGWAWQEEPPLRGEQE